MDNQIICCRSGSSFSSITYKQSVDFLLPRHYSGRKPSITFSFGYFEESELKAVATAENLAKAKLKGATIAEVEKYYTLTDVQKNEY